MVLCIAGIGLIIALLSRARVQVSVKKNHKLQKSNTRTTIMFSETFYDETNTFDVSGSDVKLDVTLKIGKYRHISSCISKQYVINQTTFRKQLWNLCTIIIYARPLLVGCKITRCLFKNENGTR